jgi:DNA-binding PadR family transcriptional regulator
MANRRGRPALTSKKFALANALKGVRNGEFSNYYYLRQLGDLGYVAATPVKASRRGRPAMTYSLTPKGNTYVNFSQNWK